MKWKINKIIINFNYNNRNKKQKDQIGGGTPGIKYISTAAGAHPNYEIEFLKLSHSHIKKFNDKMVMIYTGKTKSNR